MRVIYLAFCLILTGAVDAGEVLSPEAIAQVLKADTAGQVSTPRNILLCWSKPDHPPGTHDYEGFAESMAATLNKVESVSAVAVNGFPDTGKWTKADLVIFFLTQKRMTAAEYQQVDDHLKKGRSIIVLHQGLVHRQDYDKWAERVGYAFNWAKGERSMWGRFVTHGVSVIRSLRGFRRRSPLATNCTGR
ncbi:MAG: hypothetical protein ACI8W8_001106 [Rhodothermales bacterium]|jgi:hypothetical protein